MDCKMDCKFILLSMVILPKVLACCFYILFISIFNCRILKIYHLLESKSNRSIEIGVSLINPDLIRVNRITSVIQDGRCPKKTHAKEKASKFDLNWSKT